MSSSKSLLLHREKHADESSQVFSQTTQSHPPHQRVLVGPACELACQGLHRAKTPKGPWAFVSTQHLVDQTGRHPMQELRVVQQRPPSLS